MSGREYFIGLGLADKYQELVDAGGDPKEVSAKLLTAEHTKLTRELIRFKRKIKVPVNNDIKELKNLRKYNEESRS